MKQGMVVEQLIRWQSDATVDGLNAAHRRLFDSALDRANSVAPEAAAAFSEFREAMGITQRLEESS